MGILAVLSLVSYHQQQGHTLMDLLVSSLLGAMILMMLSSTFLSGQTSMLKRSQSLVLAKSITMVLHTMKKDVQRAGFHHAIDASVRLVGAQQVVYVAENADKRVLAYAYQFDDSETAPWYRNVAYEYRFAQAGELFLCEKKQQSVWSVTEVMNGSGDRTCYRLFDNKTITVADFAVEQWALSSEKVGSAMLAVSLSAHLTSSKNKPLEHSFTTMQRNWAQITE